MDIVEQVSFVVGWSMLWVSAKEWYLVSVWSLCGEWESQCVTDVEDAY